MASRLLHCFSQHSSEHSLLGTCYQHYTTLHAMRVKVGPKESYLVLYIGSACLNCMAVTYFNLTVLQNWKINSPLPALLQSRVDLTALGKGGLWFSRECQPILAQGHL